MTDKEIKALKEAFDFPEPDKKQEFLEEFSKLSEKSSNKRILPIVMRFAAAAAMIAVIIGVLTHMPKDTTDFGNGNDGIVTATETTSVTESTAPPTAVTTTVTDGKTVKTDKTTTSKVTGSAVTTTKTVTSSKTGAAQTTKAPSAGTAVKTTAAGTTTASKATKQTEVTQKPVTTTTEIPAAAVSPEKDDNTKDNSSSGRDMTVAPDIVYPLRDKTFTEDQLNPADNAVGAPTTSKPIDKAEMLRRLYNDSSDVILANVDEMVYTSIYGAAFTAEDLSVVSSYKGGLNENDRITAFFSGGYLPAEKYLETHNDVYIDHPEEYSVYESCESRFPQEKGAQYLFFIIKGGHSIPEGAYSSASAGNTAVFKKIADKYVSVDNGNYYFTEEMFDELR